MQNKKNIPYNKLLHESLNTVIDLKPKNENLEKSTKSALKVIFSLEKEEKIKNNPKAKEVTKKKTPEVGKSESEKLVLEKQIQERVNEKQQEEVALRQKQPSNEKLSEKVKQPNVEKQEQFNAVLLAYISKYTDLKTRVAYLKRFSSPELLQSVEEDLRKKKLEKLLEIAGVIIEEQEEKIERDEGLSTLHEQKNDDEPLDQDLFDEADFAKIAEAFNHENDDPIEFFTKVVSKVIEKEDPRQINSVINIIESFKNLTDESGKKQGDDGKKEAKHSNKLIRSLHKKYMESTPEEQKAILEQLNKIQSALKLKRNEVKSKQTHGNSLKRPSRNPNNSIAR